MTDALKSYRLHVGFAKCGSTFLQHYFRQHSKLEMAVRRKIRHLLVVSNDLAYDPSEARAYFASFALEAERDGKHAVYSSERLVGNMHTGHYDMEAIARRICKVFDGPRIVMVVREQTSLIASVYRQYLKVGGTKTLEQFIAPGDGRIPVFDRRAYEFHRVVELYYGLFGRENVLVIPFEELTGKPETALRSVCRLYSVDWEAPRSVEPRNVGFEDARLSARRRINTLFAPKMLNLRDNGGLSLPRDGMLFRLAERLEATGRFRDTGRSLADEVRSHFAGRYRDSNRRLAELLQVDLAGLGYEM